MSAARAVSDQLHDWSDRARGAVGCRPAQATCCSAEKTAVPQSDSPWLRHRTLQAMWETGMPVCERSWPRSQAVPVRQSVRSATRDGVRSHCLPRAGARVSGEPPASTGGARRSLRDQPGAAASQRGVGVDGCAGGRSRRRRDCGHAGRKHDPCSPAVGTIAKTFTSDRASARPECRYGSDVGRGCPVIAEGRGNR